MRTIRRVQLVATASSLMLIAGATSASAHHCYKDTWADAAYAHHQAGGTAWVPISDLGTQFLIPPELQEECGWAADEAVEDFMATRGLTQEPLIHSRATVGSGAAYQGKAPRPFSYLSEADFEELTVSLLGYLDTCVAG